MDYVIKYVEYNRLCIDINLLVSFLKNVQQLKS